MLSTALNGRSIDFGELRVGSSFVAILGQLLLAWVSVLEKFLTLTLLAEHLQLAMLIHLICWLVVAASILLVKRIRLRRRVALR